jgi:hypothetical protein
VKAIGAAQQIGFCKKKRRKWVVERGIRGGARLKFAVIFPLRLVAFNPRERYE